MYPTTNVTNTNGIILVQLLKQKCRRKLRFVSHKDKEEKENVIYNPSRQNWHSWLVALCFAVLLTFNRPNIEQEVSPRDIREKQIVRKYTEPNGFFFWKFSSSRIERKVWIRKKEENLKLGGEKWRKALRVALSVGCQSVMRNGAAEREMSKNKPSLYKQIMG